MLTQKQKELVELLRGVLPTAPTEVAETHVDWYPRWSEDKAFSIGDRVVYEGKLYEVIQEHKAQLDWLPNLAQSLFKSVSTEEWAEWVQPTGAHDAYGIGDKVLHNGKKWVSLVVANVWEPGATGTSLLWKEKEE